LAKLLQPSIAERFGNGRKIDQEVADGNASNRSRPSLEKMHKGQVLDREITVAVGAVNPAGAIGDRGCRRSSWQARLGEVGPGRVIVGLARPSASAGTRTASSFRS
jgi:hypothetical protein